MSHKSSPFSAASSLSPKQLRFRAQLLAPRPASRSRCDLGTLSRCVVFLTINVLFPCYLILNFWRFQVCNDSLDPIDVQFYTNKPYLALKHMEVTIQPLSYIVVWHVSRVMSCTYHFVITAARVLPAAARGTARRRLRCICAGHQDTGSCHASRAPHTLLN